jgi:hypothetical protein
MGLTVTVVEQDGVLSMELMMETPEVDILNVFCEAGSLHPHPFVSFIFSSSKGFYVLPELLQNRFIDTEIGLRAFHFAADNPGFFQDLQMLADGGLGKGEDIHNFPTHTGIDPDQMFDNLYSCRMPQGLEYFCKLFSGHNFIILLKIVHRLLTI